MCVGVYVVLAVAYIYIPNNTIALTFSDKTNTLFWTLLSVHI